MKLLVESQANPVSSEVLARISIVRPILTALLTGIKQDVMNELGGIQQIKLFMLPRAYREGSGDVGFCFEWAIHDAIRRGEPAVMERLEDASRKCRLPGNEFQSILFGVEKSGKTRIIDTANDIFSISHFVPKRAILNGIEGFTGSIGGSVTHICGAFSARRAPASCFLGLLGSFRAH